MTLISYSYTVRKDPHHRHIEFRRMFRWRNDFGSPLFRHPIRWWKRKSPFRKWVLPCLFATNNFSMFRYFLARPERFARLKVNKLEFCNSASSLWKLGKVPPFRLISSKLVDFRCCCCISRWLIWLWGCGGWWGCWLWSGGLAELAVLKDSDRGVMSSWGNPESTDLLLLGVWSS